MTEEIQAIAVEGLTKRYRDGADEALVLSGLDLEVGAGELVAIYGRSGSGKTSLLNILGGLDADFGGEVRVLGQRLAHARERELSSFRATQVGFVFQRAHLFSRMTALENVMLAETFGTPRPDPSGRALRALESVGVASLAAAHSERLSGGEAQRVAIARALVSSPRLLLCDEPTGSLDAQTAKDVAELFESLRRDRGLCVIVATHDRELWHAVASRELSLLSGKLVAT